MGRGRWLQAADIYLENPPEGEEDSMTEAELASIKARLLEMRPRALTRRAEELGISDDKLDVADEATDRKEALISLILEEQQQARKERGISMSRLESAGHDAEHAADAAVRGPHSHCSATSAIRSVQVCNSCKLRKALPLSCCPAVVLPPPAAAAAAAW